jgi:endonuclease/exonuclease/phosphatase family metal-dependent hydrolase
VYKAEHTRINSKRKKTLIRQMATKTKKPKSKPKSKSKNNIIANDNLSKSLANIIGQLPAAYRDSDEFLDIISWNLRWFNDKEPERVKNITEILGVINSDIFVFQEIQPNSLDGVASKLTEEGKGTYEVLYGTTDGDQRVAIMYDTQWIRAKDNIVELFGKGQVKTGDNKDAFPRLPFRGYFLAKSPDPSKSGFSFQLVGVHLKSQMGDGSSQRRTASEKLCWWIEKEADEVDADTIIIGDWNKDPSSSDWDAIHELEKQGKVKFSSINDQSDFSHLYYRNKNDFGSRLDIALVSSQAFQSMKNKKTEVIQWTTISDLLQSASEQKVTEIKAILNDIKENISDHMPLFTRYYLVEE